MNIQFFNFWYFLFLALSFAGFAGLYFLLRGRSSRTVNIVLISLMTFALVRHCLLASYCLPICKKGFFL